MSGIQFGVNTIRVVSRAELDAIQLDRIMSYFPESQVITCPECQSKNKLTRYLSCDPDTGRDYTELSPNCKVYKTVYCCHDCGCKLDGEVAVRFD